jgi:ubiquinone/menaquinone biosynthesis C-methylase UbiE
VGDFRNPAVVENWHASQLSHMAREEQLELLLALLERASPHRLLDLGVGSGLVAERVLDRLPDTSLVGIDFSPPMLARARKRLARFGTRVDLVEGNLAEPDGIDLPPGSYDTAFSVQTLHNMTPDEQQRVLAWLGRTLAPGGVAFLLDKLAIPEPLYDAYPVLADLPPSYSEYEANETANEEWAPLLETQLAWLRDAGLDPAVLHLRANYALIAARR